MHGLAPHPAGCISGSFLLQRLHVLDHVHQLFRGHRLLQVGGHQRDGLLLQLFDFRLFQRAVDGSGPRRTISFAVSETLMPVTTLPLSVAAVQVS